MLFRRDAVMQAPASNPSHVIAVSQASEVDSQNNDGTPGSSAGSKPFVRAAITSASGVMPL